jgi:hypothetical protein
MRWRDGRDPCRNAPERYRHTRHGIPYHIHRRLYARPRRQLRQGASQFMALPSYNALHGRPCGRLRTGLPSASAPCTLRCDSIFTCVNARPNVGGGQYGTGHHTCAMAGTRTARREHSSLRAGMPSVGSSGEAPGSPGGGAVGAGEAQRAEVCEAGATDAHVVIDVRQDGRPPAGEHGGTAAGLPVWAPARLTP